MTTVCASGAAAGPDPVEAVRSAVAVAFDRLHGAPPSLGLLFVSSTHRVDRAIATARAVVETEWVACTTAGEITEAGASHGGIAVMLISWGASRHRISQPTHLAGSMPLVAERLGSSYPELLRDAMVRGLSHSLSLVFGDGVTPNFERLITEFRRVTRLDHDIVGGGAADASFQASAVGTNQLTQEAGVVAVHIASERAWGIGMGLGVRAASPPMTITRAEGNVVHAIDGRPATAVFRSFSHSMDESIGDEDWRTFFLENQLGIFLFDEIVRVRCGLDTRGSGVLFVGEVPEGSRVAIVKGDLEAMIASARSAAKTAKDAIDGPVAGVLIFSCVSRGIVMGDRYDRELAAVREVFGPDVPIAGFMTCGEVARLRDRHDGYHNHSIVVAALPR